MGIMDCFKASVPTPVPIPAPVQRPLPCADISTTLKVASRENGTGNIIAHNTRGHATAINDSAILSPSRGGTGKSLSHNHTSKRSAESATLHRHDRSHSHDQDSSYICGMDIDESIRHDAARRPARDLDLTDTSESLPLDSYDCLPSASQLDFAFLRELPDEMQAELLGAIKRKAARDNDGGSSSSSSSSKDR